MLSIFRVRQRVIQLLDELFGSVEEQSGNPVPNHSLVSRIVSCENDFLC